MLHIVDIHYITQMLISQKALVVETPIKQMFFIGKL